MKMWKYHPFKKLLQRSIALFIFSSAWFGASSQDIHFSQFFEAPLWRNPGWPESLPAISGYNVFTVTSGTA